MMEKKLAISPLRPTQFTKAAKVEPSPCTTSSAPTNGAPWSFMKSAPAPPGASASTRAPNRISTSMAVMMPRGMSRAGSAASSAAKGTPSTARNSQMANGSAAQTPM